MPEENVRVAVRVRPFNRRERERNATLIIDMQGQTTKITDPSGGEEPRKFSFDFSYWSHDGSKEDGTGYYGPDTSHPNGKKFADQKKVYGELGVEVLKNAWEGYNSTLFAYGQTGSGKSWSVVGYGVNKGIVPMFCDDVFKQISEKQAAPDNATEFEVNFSMLEIYNEQVRDLLDPKPAKRGGLKVRQHPKKGFYAEGLIITPVKDYPDIEKKMEQGTMNRTVASTNMNATSSRAHTIVGITFLQKFKNAAGEETTKSAVTNLVDLAGSERAESTGATGDRLKEGAAINQSLSCLGNCIAALADKSSGKNTRVPYRDSVLTKLLKNALGGNSKTIMIAALSPADINFEETLSTLRYADRAKQIKNSTSVNEDPTEKLIRELQEENERLKAAIAGGNIQMLAGDDDDDDLTEEEIAQIKAELDDQYKSVLEKNEREMEEMKKSFEEKLKEAQEKGGVDTNFSEIAEKKKTTPFLSNLNLDPQLDGHIVHFIDGPEKCVGSGGDIVIRGPSMVPKHAIIKEEGGKFTVEPCDISNRLLHNGKVIAAPTEIHHSDRIIFGTTQYFIFNNMKEKESSKQQYPEVSYEMAQEEVAKKSGFDTSGKNKSRDENLLQSDILEVMPMVEIANAISQDLDKKCRFDLLIVAPEARGELKGRSEIMIKMTNIETKHEWLWPRRKFMDRKFMMDEMYDIYEEGGDYNLPPEKDPFVDDMNAPFLVGSVKIWLQSLSYNIEVKEQLDIVDYKGSEVGILNVEANPCDKSGKLYTEKDDVFVDDPKQLIGKDIHFKVKLSNARGLPSKYTDFYATYSVYLEDKEYSTKKVPNTINPDWNFEQLHSFPQSTEQFVTFLQESAIMVKIWGKHKPPKEKKSLNTKDTLLKSALTKGQSHNLNTNQKKMDAEKVKYMMEAAMLRKRTALLEMKLAAMKRMLEEADKHNKKKLSTKLINDIYHAPTADAAEKCIKMIPQEKDDDSSSSSSSSDGGKKGNKAAQNDQKKSKKSGSSSSSDSDGSGKGDKKGKKKLKPAKERNQSSSLAKSPKRSTPVASKSNAKSSSCVLL